MLFVNLEDTTGKIEVIVFPRLLAKDPNLWKSDNLVTVNGRVNNKDGTLKIIASEGNYLQKPDISEIEISEPERLVLTIPSTCKKETLDRIKNILLDYPGDLPVVIKLIQLGGFKEIKTKTKVVYDKIIISRIQQLLPEITVVFD